MNALKLKTDVDLCPQLMGDPPLNRSALYQKYRGYLREAVTELYPKMDSSQLAEIVGCTEAEIYNEIIFMRNDYGR